MGERSKVYMTDLRCRPGVSLLNKLEKLMRTAGIGEINFERKLVAIKMHFGEPGNLAFLRPNYAKVVADVCLLYTSFNLQKSRLCTPYQKRLYYHLYLSSIIG